MTVGHVTVGHAMPHTEGNRVPSTRGVIGRIVIAVAIASASSLTPGTAFADDQITVSSCPGQTALPVTFRIDCSNVKDAAAKQLCKPFIENQACKVFPAYRQITGINLEESCPSINYTIYDKDNWPGGGEAGGLTLKCAVQYLAEYSVNAKAPAKIGPYDTHELLHVYQAVLGAIPYAHILFGPSQAEAMRLIGDVEAYDRAAAQMKETTGNFEERFQKLSSRSGIERCVLAEVQVEQTLYLDNPKTVYAFYRKLVRSRVADLADRQARFDRMYNTVSEGKSRQFLIAHGCAPF
jgi:hypothetical protein